jgi:hypothetical protein
MFEDQIVELLPARTTMKRCFTRQKCRPQPPCASVGEISLPVYAPPCLPILIT